MPLVALWIPTALGGSSRDPVTARVAATGPGAPEGETLPQALVAALLAHAPRVVVTPCTDPACGPPGVLAWADARGLPARALARAALDGARELARRAVGPAAPAGVRVGIAHVPIAAELTARLEALGAGRASAAIAGVAGGRERAFLAPLPLASLAAASVWRPRDGRDDAGGAAAPWWPDVTAAAARRTVVALAGVGVEACGELAALDPDAVAVRFGAAAAALWRLARADDPRRPFAPVPRDLPAASAEWTEYELRDPAALAFVARRLVARVVDDARARGVAPRGLVLRLALGGSGAREVAVRGARAAADVAAWSRLVRDALDRVTLDDGVVGLAVRVAGGADADAPQGDFFDGGFQSAAAAERALARLVDDGDAVPVAPALTRHPLPERRVAWTPTPFDAVVAALRGVGVRGAPLPAPPAPARTDVLPLRRGAPRSSAEGGGDVGGAPGAGAAARLRAAGAAPCEEGSDAVLTLRVLAAPVPVVVTTRAWRGTRAPVRFRERRPPAPAPAPRRRGLPLVEILCAAGPDRVAVAHEGAAVTRDYWQCVTDDGRIVLLFRDVEAAEGADGAWWLHGWWD